MILARSVPRMWTVRVATVSLAEESITICTVCMEGTGCPGSDYVRGMGGRRSCDSVFLCFISQD